MSDIARAIKAQAVLDNSEFQSAIDDIEFGIVARWKACSVNDTEAQQYLKVMLKIHHDFINTLKRRLTDGKIEEIKIERQSKIAGIFRRN